MWNAGFQPGVICALARIDVNICILLALFGSSWISQWRIQRCVGPLIRWRWLVGADEMNGNRRDQDRRYLVHNIGRGSNRNNGSGN